jgi:hypothetical protein
MVGVGAWLHNSCTVLQSDSCLALHPFTIEYHMADNNLIDYDNNGQPFGYVPMTMARSRILHTSNRRASLRREVFSRMGKVKEEILRLRRKSKELEAECEVLQVEMENIGTLAFDDLEEERVAIAVTWDMLDCLRSINEDKLPCLRQELEGLVHVWDTHMTREVLGNMYLGNERW